MQNWNYYDSLDTFWYFGVVKARLYNDNVVNTLNFNVLFYIDLDTVEPVHPLMRQPREKCRRQWPYYCPV